MLVAFDVDCGEFLAGHRFLARGLRADGYSDDIVHRDYSEHVAGKPVHRMVSLTYALVPGLTADEQGSGPGVDADVVLEPPADPHYWGAILTVGGEQQPASAGSAETVGALGPFVLPEATRRVTIELAEVMPVDSVDNSRREDENTRIAGRLEIDVSSGRASWTPA